MNYIQKHIYFPDCGNLISIDGGFDGAAWKKAIPLNFGGEKVKGLGQYHNDHLYLYFKIQDNSLLDLDDKLFICVDLNDAIGANPGNGLVWYTFAFENSDGHSFYSDKKYEDEQWGNFQSPAPYYVRSWIHKDELFNYWEAVVDIDFNSITISGSELIGIHPQSFGLYLKVVDYTTDHDFTPAAWPIDNVEDGEDPYFIAPQTQWAEGRFLKRSTTKSKPIN